MKVVGNSNVAEKMGKVDKRVEIGIGNDTACVPLVEVRIWERLISKKECSRITVSKISPSGPVVETVGGKMVGTMIGHK